MHSPLVWRAVVVPENFAGVWSEQVRASGFGALRPGSEQDEIHGQAHPLPCPIPENSRASQGIWEFLDYFTLPFLSNDRFGVIFVHYINI